MDRVAVFVDAGYLFAAGSAALAGSKQPRHLLSIDEAIVVEELRKQATAAAGLPLLRIYWYDGVSNRGPSAEHQKIAACSDLKIRLGFLNSSGQQKGVDSLIVTDLIELARNRAMSDALLLAGDEDTRIGVQIAQSYGVRVHILGISPARSNQSNQLLQEADTTAEWDKEKVTSFLHIAPGLSAVAQTTPPSALSASLPTPIGIGAASLKECVCAYVDTINGADLVSLTSHFGTSQGIPSRIDGKLLATTRDRLGRDLNGTERTQIRSIFIAEIRVRASTPQP